MERVTGQRRLGPIISHRIGSQVFPNFTKTIDHRMNLTVFGINNFMSGQLIDEFIDSYIDIITRERINELTVSTLELLENEKSEQEENL